MTLIWCDPHLHTPVYFLLSQLSLMDVLYSSTFVPKTTTAFLSGRNSISFINCGIQLFLFVILVGAGCLPLAVTAYDRYAAMRHPAQFSWAPPSVFPRPLAPGWVHFSVPWSMSSTLWISLTVPPGKSTISLVRTQLSWNLCKYFSLWKWPLCQWNCVSPLSNICHHGFIWADPLHCFETKVKLGHEEGTDNLFFPFDCAVSLLWNSNC